MKNGLQEQIKTPQNQAKIFYVVAGVSLIAAGILILVAQSYRSIWITLIIPPLAGIVLTVEGILSHRRRFILPGSILIGLGLGGLIALVSLAGYRGTTRLGAFLMVFAASFAAIFAFSIILIKRPAWWSLLVAGIIASLGACFIFSPIRVVDFALYLSLGVGLVLLSWGTSSRLLGLIIPGSLLMGIGPGIFLAWRDLSHPNSLAQTGIMLVVFAFGWVLITLFSRLLYQRFLWWPLIPAGIMAMVGWGLYLGGNPGNALSFIGNTGSIGLIIFGLYLLLMRKGIQG